MRDGVPLYRGGEGYVENVERKVYDEGTAVDKVTQGEEIREGKRETSRAVVGRLLGSGLGRDRGR